MVDHFQLAPHSKSRKEEAAKGMDDGEEMDDDAESDDAEVVKGEQGLLRELKHKIETTLSQPQRRLLVREVTFVFQPESIYGLRSGAVKGWIVTAKTPTNLFHRSKAWRHQVVMGITMQPRDLMWKPERPAALTMSAAFTDVQEAKQAVAGTSFIRVLLASLLEGVGSAAALVDAHGYDAWPALAALEEWENGRRWYVATVVQASPELAPGVCQACVHCCLRSCACRPLGVAWLAQLRGGCSAAAGVR